MVNPNKSHLPRSMDLEWIDKPGQKRLSRITRLINNTDTRQENLIKKTQIPDVIPEGNYSTIYALDENKKWKTVGYKCMNCGKTMSKTNVAINHPLICTNELKINTLQEEEIMPVHRVIKNGETYFKWGDTGKLYKTKEEAEKQGRAIYAQGYKQKDQKK